MQISEILSNLGKCIGKTVTQTEVARVLGMSSVALNKRLTRGSEFKPSELVTLSNHYNCNLFDMYIQNGNLKTKGLFDNSNYVEIKYYNNTKNSSAVKSKQIANLYLDSNLVHNIWNKDERNLCTLKMPGDSMDGGETPIKNNDMLIVDKLSRDISSSGIYAYTTNDENFIFVNGIMLNVDGSVRVLFYNKKYPEITYTQAELDKVNFKIIGRVIKNISSLD